MDAAVFEKHSIIGYYSIARESHKLLPFRLKKCKWARTRVEFSFRRIKFVELLRSFREINQPQRTF